MTERGERLWLAALGAGAILLGLLAGAEVNWGLGPVALVLGVGGVAGGMAWLVGRLIMAQRRAARELRRELVQAQKLAGLGQMAAAIAHELNTPLMVISQEAEWMRHRLTQEGVDLRGEAESLLDQVEAQVRRCAETTQRLLQFARKMEPVMQPVDLNHLVGDLTRLLELEAAKHGVGVSRQLDAGLTMGLTDAPLLRLAVLNLLKNAMQAAGPGGRVEVATGRQGRQRVWVRVRDTGPGVPEDLKDRIFDPFFSTKPQGQGSGLGLALCQSVTHALGGLLTVDNLVQGGAEFRLTLPWPPPPKEP